MQIFWIFEHSVNPKIDLDRKKWILEGTALIALPCHVEAQQIFQLNSFDFRMHSNLCKKLIA